MMKMVFGSTFIDLLDFGEILYVVTFINAVYLIGL